MLSKRQITDFFDLISRQNTVAVKELLTEEAVLFFPKTAPIKTSIKIIIFFKILWRYYPELVYDLNEIILDWESAAVSWNNKGAARNG